MAVALLAATSVVGPTRAGAAASSATGNDVSYTGCGGTLPPGAAFGIVGVNGGLANNRNPCLGSELYWAVATTTGATAQPLASLYVNTGDPGPVVAGTLVSDWPTSGTTPYGPCTTTTVSLGAGMATVGQRSDACAWEYGEQRASQDARWLQAAADAVNAATPPVTVPDAPGSYPWWLDVETSNSWLTGSAGQAMNVAALQGMVAALGAAGATSVGVYSTTTMWDQITGAPSSFLGTIAGLDDWVPGASTAGEARANCGLAPFTDGAVTLTQWTGSNLSVDGDVACGTPAASPRRSGYREVASDGGMFSFGDAGFHGSMGGQRLNARVVGMATDPATGGYWEVAADGGIFAFGAPFYGSMGGQRLNAPIVGMAGMPTGSGYWEVAADGGIFAFGAAGFHGSMGGQRLNRPIVAMAADPTTGGYWEVAADGGVFNFAAPFLGSMGGRPLNAPVVGVAATATGEGYHEVAADGGMFTFGNAQFYGSMGGRPLNAPVVAVVST